MSKELFKKIARLIVAFSLLLVIAIPIDNSDGQWWVSGLIMLAACVGVIALLWPWLWRWRDVIEIRIFSIYGAIITLFFNNINNGSTVLAASIFFLGTIIFIGSLVAAGVDKKIRQEWITKFKRWFAGVLGTGFGSYIVFAMWLLTLLLIAQAIYITALGAAYVGPPYIVPGIDNAEYLSRFTILFANEALPLCILLFAIHWFKFRADSVPKHKVFFIGNLFALLAILSYLAPIYLPVWPHILGADVPDMVSEVINFSWRILAAIIAIMLVNSTRKQRSAFWWAIGIGSIGGLLFIILLSPPVFVQTLNRSLTHVISHDGEYQTIRIISYIVSVLLLFLIGPVTATIVQSSNRIQKALFGGLAVGVTSVFIYTGIINFVIALTSYAPIFEISQTPAIFTSDERILSTVNVYNLNLLWSILFWFVVPVGGMIGFLTALLAPVKQNNKRKFDLSWDDMQFGLMIAILILGVMFSLNVVWGLGITSTLQQGLTPYGFEPTWKFEWNVLLVVGQIWMVLVILQLLFLAKLRKAIHAISHRKELSTSVTLLVGVAGCLIPVSAFLWFGSEAWSFSPWVLSLAIVNGLLGLATLRGLWQQWYLNIPEEKQSDNSKKNSLAFGGWQSGVLCGAFLATALSIQDLGIITDFYRLALSSANVNTYPLGVQVEELITIFHELAISQLAFLSILVLFLIFASISIFPLLYYLSSSLLLAWSKFFYPHYLEQYSRLTAENNSWFTIRLLFSRRSDIFILTLLLLAAIDSPLLPFVLIAITFPLSMIFFNSNFINHVAWKKAIFAFALIGTGFALTYLYRNALLSQSSVQSLIVLTLVPGMIFLYKTINVFVSKKRKLLLGWLILIVLPITYYLIASASLEQTDVQAGLARFDGQQWENLAANNSVLGGRLNYRIYKDSQGDLWFSDGAGILAGNANRNLPEMGTSWQLYLRDIDAPSTQTSPVFAQTATTDFWLGRNKNLGYFDNSTSIIRTPGYVANEPRQFENNQAPACVAGAVYHWDTESGLEPHLFSANMNSIYSIQSNPAGTRLLIQTDPDNQNSTEIWATTGELLAAWPNETVIGVATDSSYIATKDSNQVTLRNEIGQPLFTTPDLGFAQSIRFSPDTTQFLAIGFNSVELWSAEKDHSLTTLEGHNDGIQMATFSHDGSRILTVDKSGQPFLWDGKGSLIRELEQSDELITAVAFAPDNKQFITGYTNGRVHVWNIDGTLIRRIQFFDAPVGSIEFNPDSSQILTLSEDGFAYLNKIALGETIRLTGLTGRILSAHFSPNGNQIITKADGAFSVWEPDGNLIITLAIPNGASQDAIFSPDGESVYVAGCVYNNVYERFQLQEAAITDLVIGPENELWIATNSKGVAYFTYDRQIENGRWQFFSTSQGLPSNRINALQFDNSGILWAATDKGIARYDGDDWQTVALIGAATHPTSYFFLQTSKGHLLVGTSSGVYQLENDEWRTLGSPNSWPRSIHATFLLEDQQGGIWAGTDSGAIRYDGRDWTNLVPDVAITTFLEQPPAMWIGTQSGLIRYDMSNQEQARFDITNSGLPANWIRDIQIGDVQNELWVSTFAASDNALSQWWGIGLAVLLFGFVHGSTYQGYQQSPITRARHLGQGIVAQPNELYSTLYALLQANDGDMLPAMAAYLMEQKAVGSAKIVDAFIELINVSDEEYGKPLEQLLLLLKTDGKRTHATFVYEFSQLLQQALAASSINEISRLELRVDPGQSATNVVLRWRDHTISEEWPAFVSRSSIIAWQALERVGLALRKYEDVDASTDQLSYLAQALTAVEAAQTAVSQIGLPEGPIMRKIADNWRMAVNQGISIISGHAELRLELRTRQLRRAERVTIALRLQNVGRAAAENLSVVFALEKDEPDVGDQAYLVQRLPSGQSELIEFPINPPESDSLRIVCQLLWKDQNAETHTLEFADVVRFYETPEGFVTIPNPYIVGHPVKGSQMFHGREDAFRFIAQNLEGVADRTLVLHGQRRTGKTSILYQLLNGRLGSNFVPVLIDMQELAPIIENTADFLGEMAYQLARTAQKASINIDEPEIEAFEKSAVRTFNRFLDRLDDSLGDRRLIIMFDEFELIEGKISEGKLDADLLGYFRSLMQHRQRLVFIFTGTHRLEEMSHDYWSILFNIALYRRISFLNRADAVRLIREPVSGKLDVDELAVEKIINLTSGHAYFTQLICWALVNHCNNQRQNYATINDVNDAVKEIVSTGEAHFAYVWQQASSHERLALGALAHTIRPGKPWARPAELLKTLQDAGDHKTSREQLVTTLERLTSQEVLESASEGNLRYRFQLEILQLWLTGTHSIVALVELESGV